MRGNRWLAAGALALLMSFMGCDCGDTPPGTDDDAGVVDGQDAGNGQPDGGDGTVLDGGPGSRCVAAGAICSRDIGAQCCTGVCGEDGRCPEPNPLCRSAGEACSSGIQCCTNVCSNGTCGASQCLDIGGACSNAEECCTKTCTNGTCAQIPSDTTSACKVVGQACGSDGDCCSTNCQAGICARAYSCQGYNDICTNNAECCGNACSANGDGGVGRCQFVTGGGGGGCIQDGNPCSDGSTCCSRTCVDLGYGATVCQPVGGCKLTGNFCTRDSDCCGGGTYPDGGPINPNGSVKCSNGRCDNGQSCNGVGNICGAGKLPDGGMTDINASQNCCDGRKAVCHADSTGVPRCFGGSEVDGGLGACPSGYTGEAGCCIAQDATCQFSDQCCDGALCLPAGDGTGRLSCQKPTCAPVGTPCDDPGVTCCAGTQCLPNSELTKACLVPYTPPPSDGGTPSTDGGTPPADAGTGGTCQANGATCSAGSQCCSGICSGGTCQAPQACQPQNGACTSGSDCCQGLRCDIPLGTVTGTCQPGATCSTSGQACLSNGECCSGLTCATSTAEACDGTSACVCQLILK